MGMESTVVFANGSVPAWPPVRDRLAAAGTPATMRMIDGELAFPDETPPEGWREIRVSLSAGMITVRRGTDRVMLVVWGNAEGPLLADRDTLAKAFAEAGGKG